MFLTSTDQLSKPPLRIISLVPSQTELLYHLGLEKETIGITKFCIHPNYWIQSKIIVGGTKNINIQKIIDLKPDLIIANKEENVKEQIEALTMRFPVLVTDVSNLNDAFEMIYHIGQDTNKQHNAEFLLNKIRDNFSQETSLAIAKNSLKTAYLIWRKPYMTIGGDTYINSIMAVAGFENVFAPLTRYPQVSVDDLRNSGCELILLSSEPYPFKQKHIEELQQHLPQVKIILVDGEMFSWYGSRLLLVPDYLKKLREQIG